MTLRETAKLIAKRLNENQGVIGGLALIVAMFSLFNFKIDIFSWPAIFMALPAESKMWYLWIFNFFVTALIGLLLLNKINNSKSESGKRFIQLLNSEIEKIEKIIDEIPDFRTDGEMVGYAVSEFQNGKRELVGSTPIYSACSKEMLEFSDDLRNSLVTYYELIVSLERDHNTFHFETGSTPNIFTIRKFFENATKAKAQVIELKRIIKKELDG